MPRPHNRPDRLNAVDWTLICILSAFLFAVCALRSRTRLFWADELYGDRLIGDPSFLHMLHAWREGADGGGLFYYLLARLWTHLFGLSELTLRLFSTLGMSAGLALTWAAARRYFSTVAVAWAVAVVYLTPAVMVWQELNGRFYGTFLAAAALAGLLFLITADGPLTRRTLALTALAHAFLIGSHILGLVYSFTLIACMVALDLTNRRLRWPLYLAAATGWLMVPVSWHAIRASSSIATNIFWTHKPTPTELLAGIAILGRPTLWLLLAALGGALLVRQRRQHASSPFLNRAPAFLVAAMFSAQLILFAKSQVGISIYSDRYLLPVSVGTVLLFAASFTQFLPASSGAPFRALLLSAVGLIPCAAFAFTRNVNYALYPASGYIQRLTPQLPDNAPLIASIPEFTLLTHYDPAHHYLFMTDWPYDLSPSHPALDYSGERLMENWQRAGYEPDHILTCTQIFARYPDLYLLLDFHRVPWFNDRLLHNPSYQLKDIGHFHEWYPLTLWSVHRISPGNPPC